MAYSYTAFTGNGSTTQYAVAFAYIRREHVAVTVAGIPATFTWVNNSLIQMDAAPANGAAVRVYRTTPIDAPLVDFADGATLVAADLDTNSRQSIYIQQELDDAQVDNLPNLIPNGNKGEITTSVGGTVWAINTGAVTEAKLAANAVTSGKIADGAVIETKIGTGAVTSAKILDGTILNADVNASAGITAGKLSFTQTGTSAVARTVDGKLKDTVSAKDFGATGDGTTDDTAAIQAAINAVNAKGGGVLFFPVGTYKVTATILLKPFVDIKGEVRGEWGTGNPGVRFDKRHGNDVFYADAATAMHGVTFENFHILGNNPTSLGGGGIRILNCNSVMFKFVWITAVTGHAFVVGRGTGADYHNYFYNCYALSCDGDGFRIGSDWCRLVDCWCDETANGINIFGGSWAYIERVHLEAHTVSAINISGTNGFANSYTKISNSIIYSRNVDAHGINFAVGAAGYDIQVTKTRFVKDAGGGTCYALNYSSNCNTLTVTSCDFIGYTAVGNPANNPSGSVIFTNNYISSPFTALGAIIDGNTFTGTVALTDCSEINNTYNSTFTNSKVSNTRVLSRAPIFGVTPAFDATFGMPLQIGNTIFGSDASAHAFKTGTVSLNATNLSSGNALAKGAKLTFNQIYDNRYSATITESGYICGALLNGGAGNTGGGLYLGTTAAGGSVGTDRVQIRSEGFMPAADNTYTLGNASFRWSTVYATTGTINTSDERTKQDIDDLSDAEKRVAIKLKSLVKKFRFKDAIGSKGDDARIHVGVIAQDVIDAFASEGLDPMRYAIICYDEWEKQTREIYFDRQKTGTDGELLFDEEGNPKMECVGTGEFEVICEAGNRYGIRYEELLAFIISTL
jgi:hypothetical protein